MAAATAAGAEGEWYDVVVVGAGHAGCEAALAAARMGASTLLLTLNLDRIGWQPCNPAIGGPAKSQLVHEVDAMGGEMGRMADRCYLQVCACVRGGCGSRGGDPGARACVAAGGARLPPTPSPCLARLNPQKRVLNRSKGPAVWALRAQTDKLEYAATMRRVLEDTPGLHIREGAASLPLQPPLSSTAPGPAPTPPSSS